MIWRLIYSFFFYLIQPLIWLRLAYRARKQPEYLHDVKERYGFYPQAAPEKLIWLHAVSVGETRAAEPLIKALLNEYPDYSVLMTHMTPTGRATGGELIAKYGSRLIQAYLPYDLPCACRRFFKHFRPAVGLLMETEIWPNLINTARKQNIPVALINARLSAKSQKGYAKLRPLTEATLKKLSAIAAQTMGDAERLESIGAENVKIFGNIKFDVTPAPEKLALGKEWKAKLAERQIWLAASTREGEETLILDAFQKLNDAKMLLVLVPRHPQRFNEVYAAIEDRKLPACRRSEGGFPDQNTQVWLGDSMGEMPAYFSLADIALMGGTLAPLGGQNLIEAAACGCPVLVGPHTFNFLQATEDSLAAGAALRIQNADEAARQAQQIMNTPTHLKAMQEAAATFSQMHRGATDKTIALVKSLIKD